MATTHPFETVYLVTVETVGLIPQIRCCKTHLLFESAQMVDVQSQQRNCLELVIFVAQVHHGLDEICSNGGRAEQSTKMFGIDFVDAHGPTELL